MPFRVPAPDGRKDARDLPVTVLPEGSVLQGGYVLTYLGGGGMSVVYRGKKEDSVYLVKEVDAAEPRHIIALTQEKFMLERMSHEGIVKVYDLVEQDGFYYLVLEFVDGETLDRLIPPQPNVFLQEKVVVDWALQLCAIFEYLHSQSPPVIYRDLKPQNVMKDRSGRIRLIDFGIARNLKEDKTIDTSLLGSLCTASPEHFGAAQTDERSDIYTLGATLHFLLTNGRGTGGQMFVYSSVRSINPRVSETLDGIIRKATEYEPARRYADMKALRADLQRCAAEPVPAQASPSAPKLRISFAAPAAKAPEEAGRKAAPPEPEAPLPREPAPSAETNAIGEEKPGQGRARKLLVPAAIVAGFVVFVVLTAVAVVLALGFFSRNGPPGGPPSLPPSQPSPQGGAFPGSPPPDDGFLGTRPPGGMPSPPPGMPPPGPPATSQGKGILISDKAAGYIVHIPAGYTQLKQTPPRIGVFFRHDPAASAGRVALHIEVKDAEGKSLDRIREVIEKKPGVSSMAKTKVKGLDALRFVYCEAERREEVLECLGRDGRTWYILKAIAPADALPHIGGEFEEFFQSFIPTN